MIRACGAIPGPRRLGPSRRTPRVRRTAERSPLRATVAAAGLRHAAARRGIDPSRVGVRPAARPSAAAGEAATGCPPGGRAFESRRRPAKQREAGCRGGACTRHRRTAGRSPLRATVAAAGLRHAAARRGVDPSRVGVRPAARPSAAAGEAATGCPPGGRAFESRRRPAKQREAGSGGCAGVMPAARPSAAAGRGGRVGRFRSLKPEA